MAPLGAKKSQDKTTVEIINDLWLLIRDYAKQETLDPLRTLGQLFKWGIGGAICISLGVVLGVLGILRFLQTETGQHLTGSYTWVQYAVGVLVTGIVMVLAARAITKPNRAIPDPNRADGARS